MRRANVRWAGWWAILLVAGTVRADDAEQFFERDVRPLLVQSCLGCHGPQKQQAGLRLDSRAGLLQGSDNGAVLDVAQLDRSRLLDVIGYAGPIKMPPKQPLPAAQVAILRKWVLLGAPFPAATTPAGDQVEIRPGPISADDRRHWAYQPVTRPVVPDVVSKAWPASDIDRFVLAKLEQAKLAPATDADKLTLLRRVTFDLTGLPPTPAEMHAFLADAEPEAFARVVARLLDSPHFGERWGRHWLDLVRYADTAGDGADYPVREAYLYRNWVINALNADKPYDRFLREQIAGDVLAKQAAAAGTITPEQFAEQVTATGYIAVTKRFGYNINTEFQHLDIADTLETLGRSVLGLSIGCARCHDHKYDAVTADDYYALYGIFSSSHYSFPGGEEYKRPHNLVPLATPAQVAAAEEQRRGELAQLDQRKAALEQTRQQLGERITVGVSRDPGWELQPLGGAGGSPWMTAGPNKILAEAQSPYTHVLPAGSRGVRVLPGQPGDGIRQTFDELTKARGATFYFNVDFRNVDAPEGDRAYRLFLSHGAVQAMGLECRVTGRAFSIRNGDKFQVVRPLETGAWYNLQVALDLEKKTCRGRLGRPGDVVEFTDVALAPGWDGVLNMFISDGSGEGQGTLPTRDIDNVVGRFEPFAPLPAKLDAATAHAPAESLDAVREELARLETEFKQLAQTRTQIESKTLFPMAYGVSEGQPANVRLQKRGEPLRLGDEVPRRFLEILGGDPLPAAATGSGRLELAEWLTRPGNPLTARVMVNRVWEKLLGRGIVATPSDFGVRGERPSHPELLDHLATQFIDDGWSLKTLIRRIVLSRVYQLQSTADAPLAAGDPGNLLFGRHRRRALDAESIRDAMLFVSGELNPAQGGPHPFPDVNSWSFTIHYPFHAVYDSHHRSVYLMIQRARRHPFLQLFDAADPNISTDLRQTTITPTQSLYLLNSPFVHAQSAAFARRALAAADAEPARIQLAWEQTASRPPSAEDVAQVAEFLQACRDQLPAGAPPAEVEQEAWSALARVLLTSNRFLYVD